jgi:ABC-type bacteriocin/lantibiotic exporter with double-glycine peptidase domain
MATRKKMQRIAICLALALPLAPSGASPDSGVRKAPEAPAGKAVLFRANAVCGPNCLWQVAKACGVECSLNEIATSAGTDSFRGTTVEGMLRACRQIGLPAAAVRTGLENVAADPRVAILLLNADRFAHYAILDSVGQQNVRLLDGSQFRELPIHGLKDVWTGVAILVGDPPRRTNAHVGAALQRIGLAIVLGGVACFAVMRLGSGRFGRRQRLT